MRTIDAVFGKKIPLSKTGTNDTTTVRFDVKAWQDAYPECTITLIHKRPVDPTGLPVNVLPVVDGKALWLVSNADTHYAGDGECELVMNKGQANAKSVTYYTEITESVGSQEEDPPEPYEGFVDYVAQKASDATTAKNDAESARDEAIEAVEGVEEAKDIAIEAKNDAVEAKNDAISAKEDAIDAKGDAETASETAISAKNDAVSAKDDAVSAKNDAVTAKNDAVSAKTAAETAQTGAETAQTAAETAQTAAETAQAAAEAAAEEAQSVMSTKMDKQNPVGYNNLNVGSNNTLSGYNLYALGSGNSVQGYGSGAFGIGNEMTYGEESFAFGHYNTSTAYYTFVEGFENSVEAQYAHAEGYQTTASGNASHSEGYSSDATGSISHAEGLNTTASGDRSHAEGNGTIANGAESHAEGNGTSAEGSYSHSEGYSTTASGSYSHAEGNNTVASGLASHTEGYNTTAQGVMNHAEGYETQANGNYQHVQGAYNIKDTQGKYADIIGGGDNTARKNIETVDWSGNMELAGDLSINACGGANPVQVGTKLSSHDTSIDTLNTSVVSLNQAIDTLEDAVETKAEQADLVSVNHNLQLQVEDLKQALYGSVVDGAVDSYEKLDTAPLNASVTVDGSAYPVVRGTRLMLNKVEGITEKWNQNYDFDTTSFSACSETETSEGFTCVGDGTGTPSFRNTIANGHKYFVRFKAYPHQNMTAFAVTGFNTTIRNDSPVESAWNEIKGVGIAIDSAMVSYFNATNNTGATTDFKDVIIVDLTQIGYGDITSTDDPRIAEIEAIALAHPEYDAGSIHSPVVSGLSVTGKNLINLENITSGKYIDGYTGNLNNTGDGVVSEYIKVEPNTTYTYQQYSNVRTRVTNCGYEYDLNKNGIGSLTAALQTTGPNYPVTFTTSANTHYIRLHFFKNNNYTAGKQMLEVGSTATAYEPYHEPTTITIPSTTLRGVGTAKDNVQAIKQTDGTYNIDKTVYNNQKTIDLSNGAYNNSINCLLVYSSYNYLYDANGVANNNVVPNLVCDYFVTNSAANINGGTGGIGYTTTKDIYIRDSSCSSKADYTTKYPNGLEVVYELATPVTTTIATGLTYAEVTALNEGGLISAINTESAYVQPDVDIDVVIRKAVENNA